MSRCPICELKECSDFCGINRADINAALTEAREKIEKLEAVMKNILNGLQSIKDYCELQYASRSIKDFQYICAIENKCKELITTLNSD
jgi:5-bromo-4-chloroindolyl phosphate hydrolysis protein